MANHQDWDDLGRDIQNIIDRAINSQDYRKLNQTIRQTVERAVDVGSEAVRRAQQAKAPKVVEAKQDLSVLYGSTGGKTAGGVLQIVGGGLLLAGTLAGTVVSAVMGLIFGGGVALPGLGTLLGLGGGGLLICSGVNTMNKLSRFKTYRKLLGDKTHCTLEKLARGVKKSVKFVRKELRGMIDQGLFLEGHLDKEETHLITSHETYQLFERSRLQLEARQRAEQQVAPAPTRSAVVQEVLDKGQAFVAQIRRCNDAIPGVEISGKISHMEMLVQRIFDRVETHPEIVPDLKKLLDYYLPMTVKLLNAYAEMDAQPVQGENIRSAKREIEQTLDTLNAAFEKLMDELFLDTALDVSSDISVLNTMLAQEGLTEDALTKLRKTSGTGE